jgi:hypothetical protein
MLQRRTTAHGLVYYASPRLEAARIPHAFSTRIGGVSSAPFDSQNLGNPSNCAVQDSVQNIHENYRRLQSAIGCGNRPRFWVHQMHGGDVAVMRHGQPFESGIKADAIVSNDPTRLPLVRTADCAPALIATSDGKVVAAIHAGWRGTLANVVGNAIKTLLDLANNPPPHSLPASLLAAIGPCIGEELFEVGPEVIEAFDAQFGKAAVTRRLPDGKGRVNLPQAVHIQLLNAGLSTDHIDTTDRCTFRDRDEFFSHRRDKGITGRMAALIGARPIGARLS